MKRRRGPAHPVKRLRNIAAKGAAACGSRYVATIVIGLCVDITIAWTLEVTTGWPLVLCSAIGFLIAVAVNYALFEYWVFETGRFSPHRLALSYATSLGAIAVRLAAISALALVPWEGDLAVLAKLVAAAGLSFVVNFIFVAAIFNRS